MQHENTFKNLKAKKEVENIFDQMFSLVYFRSNSCHLRMLHQIVNCIKSIQLFTTTYLHHNMCVCVFACRLQKEKEGGSDSDSHTSV